VSAVSLPVRRSLLDLRSLGEVGGVGGLTLWAMQPCCEPHGNARTDPNDGILGEG